jgi:hypothetical protein
MPEVHTSIEIAATPAAVRNVFLGFPKFGEWHNSFFKSIAVDAASPQAKAAKTGALLQPGDTLNAVIGLDSDFTLHPIIVRNTANEFSWTGKLYGIPGLFTGNHVFTFNESKNPKNPGGTTFTQAEFFSGVGSLLIQPGSSMHTQTAAGFTGFNEDLKKKCEQM